MIDKIKARVMFIHGLESNVPSEKTKYLEKHFTLFAPQIDYRKQNIFAEVLEMAKDFKPELIIGSSMGGYFGYYIAGELNLPAILFNPALPYRTTIKPEINSKNIHLKIARFVLGKNDNIIKAKDNLNWISKNQNYIDDISISMLNFEHRVPIEIFIDEIENYYRLKWRKKQQ
jgi:predicted esterase YcpF (UPF0227 family)